MITRVKHPSSPKSLSQFLFASSFVLGLLFSSAPGLSEDLVESYPEAALRAKISIIIDDFGYSFEPGKQFADLPHPITMAVIPFTPYGNKIAKLAKTQDKEVMLHAPMETMATTKWEKSLNVSMDEIEISAMINEMVQDIPHIKGVNNHGGSKLTQDKSRMDWIMAYLAEKQLYFVDSRTTAATIAADAALEANIPYSARDVFLDNNKSKELIRVQLHKLAQIALKQGRAIGIGHPYPETKDILLEELPKLSNERISVVEVSKLLVHLPRSAIKSARSSTSEQGLAHIHNLD